MTDEQYETVCKDLDELKSKSEEEFNKLMTYIAAGSLGVSLTFIEKIVPLNGSSFVWCLIICWGSFGATLMLNLFSHYYSSRMIAKTKEDFQLRPEKYEGNAMRRNRRINCINIFQIILLFIGILFLILFSSLNAKKLSKMEKKIVTVKNKELETKGFTINIYRPMPQPQPVQQPSPSDSNLNGSSTTNQNNNTNS